MKHIAWYDRRVFVIKQIEVNEGERYTIASKKLYVNDTSASTELEKQRSIAWMILRPWIHSEIIFMFIKKNLQTIERCRQVRRRTFFQIIPTQEHNRGKNLCLKILTIVSGAIDKNILSSKNNK